MGKNELKISEIMKFSRHDHMNDMQLLLMYLDMGKYQEAKECILEKTSEMQQFAMLQRLGLPKTEEWLMMLDWKYPVFNSRLCCDIASEVTLPRIDAMLVGYLESLVKTVMSSIDQYAECTVMINVVITALTWSIQLSFSDIQGVSFHAAEDSDLLTIEILNESEQCTVILSGKLGGL
ncbi:MULTISPECIES: Spo0B domain-containing protein [Sporosarcina]|uniref:Spo0B domain-containing protein n=1 Tax=Sporosarcina TaxID=1569 RepID=UPI00129B1981|nr:MULTISPECIES: Spo0B domain-containing protein [Sporosarcina]GKV65725.1 hypothetical protein NCCP2331_18780 [Sporosarcina sp. NCCP-2331]GLB55849.1 hypothetical protein NCCP2378_16360 [Sporosarcina sp. NCCP-2378]